MSSWRALQLSDQPDGKQIPQLLVKTHFGSDVYTVFLTDLSSIWSEELDLAGIAHRASTEESPIEVSKHDTAQLTILLDHVKRSLASHDDTTCRITKTNDVDGLVLHTTTPLPEPLDSLKWTFHLRKRNPMTLMNELLLPLLISSHVQQERIAGLIKIVSEKDRAITRLTDQFESTNMDLAAAFPSIGGTRLGRKIVNREQAAKHVSGLRPFDQGLWMTKTAESHHASVSTPDLFQDVLSHCTPTVPPSLKSGDETDTWWLTIDSKLQPIKQGSKKTASITNKLELPTSTKPTSDTEDDETEDEFETHENFKLRNPAQLKSHVQEPSSPPDANGDHVMDDATTDEEVDDDLDAPIIKSQSQSQSQSCAIAPSPPKTAPAEAQSSPPPQQDALQPAKPKSKGFHIGGRSSRTRTPSVAPEVPAESVNKSDEMPTRPKIDEEESLAAPKPARKAFKIGGKAKLQAGKEAEALTDEHGIATHGQGRTITPASSAPKVEETSQAEDREETAEEKAERKRQELKRKNEELAKKAQGKKKRRF